MQRKDESCDTSTPKSGFNMYNELKTALISLGVPETQIAYIHDAETEAKRTQLFMKVRNGEVRILIGSTFKLGLGVNIQDRLIALHHIDIPWRPADMTQREAVFSVKATSTRRCIFTDISPRVALMHIRGSCLKQNNGLFRVCFPDRLRLAAVQTLRTRFWITLRLRHWLSEIRLLKKE